MPKAIHVIVALVMLSVGVPKLADVERLREGYRVLSSYFGVDDVLFRWVTGLTELGIAALLIVGLKGPERYRNVAAVLGYQLLMGTMCGAIFSEIVIRPGEKPWLLVLAVVLLITASVALARLVPKVLSQLRSP